MEILHAIAEWRTPFLDSLFLALTKLGEDSISLVIVALLYWCISKRMAYSMGFAYFFSGLAVNSMKLCFRVDRPWVLDPGFSAVEAAKAHATGYSFPSGHTQAATAMYGSLAVQVKNGWLKALFLLCVPVVGFSRMYLGVHTPADVLVSFGIAAISVIVFALLFRKDEPSLRFITAAGIVLIVCAAAAAGYALYLRGNGVVSFENSADICKLAGATVGLAVGCIIERRFVNFDPRTGTMWQQVFKLVVGAGIALALKAGLKPVFALIADQSPALDALRYAIIIIWVVLLWPAIFSRFIKAPEAPQNAE